MEYFNMSTDKKRELFDCFRELVGDGRAVGLSVLASTAQVYLDKADEVHTYTNDVLSCYLDGYLDALADAMLVLVYMQDAHEVAKARVDYLRECEQALMGVGNGA